VLLALFQGIRREAPSCGETRQAQSVAIIGAVVGGFLFTAVGATGITGFNLYSMFVAIVGAIVVLWGYHAISGRST
jgi:Transglycosylase associated protein